MTIHFAAARSVARSPVAWCLAGSVAGYAVNDNEEGAGDDLLLHAALRHFARHGIGAARAARESAQQAFFAGDRECYLWWLGVCRTLDRRLARGLEQSVSG